MTTMGSSLASGSISGQPQLTVTVNTDQLPMERIVSVKVRCTENKHDVVEMRLGGTNGTGLADLTDAYVRFGWGDAAVRTAFVGRITTVEPLYESGVVSVDRRVADSRYPIRSIDVTCFGASVQMRTSSVRTWFGRTVPSIVRELAAVYHFSCEIDGHDYLWPVITQDGCTDWEMLLRLGDMLGFIVTLSGTHLRFLDPTKSITRPGAVVHAATSTARLSGLATDSVRIMRFKGSYGSWTTQGFGGGFVSEGVDAVTGKPFVVATDRYGNRRSLAGNVADTNTDRFIYSTSGDQQQTMVDTDAHARRNYWPVSARMRCSGSPLFVVGNLCMISGTASEQDGYWVVRSVDHEMSTSKYECDVLLGRDSTGAGEVLRPNVPFERLPPSVLINGQWVSSRG